MLYSTKILFERWALPMQILRLSPWDSMLVGYNADETMLGQDHSRVPVNWVGVWAAE